MEYLLQIHNYYSNKQQVTQDKKGDKEMMRLVVSNKAQGWFQSYNLSSISKIEYGKASKFYSGSDIRGNDMRPGDPVMIIHFTDGQQATFSSNGDEEITFEED